MSEMQVAKTPSGAERQDQLAEVGITQDEVNLSQVPIDEIESRVQEALIAKIGRDLDKLRDGSKR